MLFFITRQEGNQVVLKIPSQIKMGRMAEQKKYLRSRKKFVKNTKNTGRVLNRRGKR